MNKAKNYMVSWRSRSNNSLHGMVKFRREPDEKAPLLEWGKEKLLKYVAMTKRGEIHPSDSTLSYCVYYEFIKSDDLQFLSCFRVIESRDEVGDIDSKTKEKITKLLNLSMSDNENESKLAMNAAIRLMKKNSITREDLDGQKMIMIKMKPQGSRVSTWEQYLYGGISKVSGVFMTFISASKAKHANEPTLESSIELTGRERDVLNASYVIENYVREITRMTSEAKKKNRWSTKVANDYRFGLILGALKTIQNGNKHFFSMQDDKLYDIVPIDTRAKEAESLLMASASNGKIARGVNADAFLGGEEDGKKIVVRHAAEDKTSNVQKISNK